MRARDAARPGARPPAPGRRRRAAALLLGHGAGGGVDGARPRWPPRAAVGQRRDRRARRAALPRGGPPLGRARRPPRRGLVRGRPGCARRRRRAPDRHRRPILGRARGLPHRGRHGRRGRALPRLPPPAAPRERATPLPACPSSRPWRCRSSSSRAGATAFGMPPRAPGARWRRPARRPPARGRPARPRRRGRGLARAPRRAARVADGWPPVTPPGPAPPRDEGRRRLPGWRHGHGAPGSERSGSGSATKGVRCRPPKRGMNSGTSTSMPVERSRRAVAVGAVEAADAAPRAARAARALLEPGRASGRVSWSPEARRDHGDPHLARRALVDDGTEDDVRVGMRGLRDGLGGLVDLPQRQVLAARDGEQDACARPRCVVSSSGEDTAWAGGLDRPRSPVPMPMPSSAGPASDMIVRTSAKSRLMQARERDQVGDALHALAQHVVGDPERVDHRGLLVEHGQQPVVRHDDERVDLLARAPRCPARRPARGGSPRSRTAS